MPNRKAITSKNGWNSFQLERLLSKEQLNGFNCSVAEYNDYLNADAFRAWKDHIAFTLLLREKETNAISAYMSLIRNAYGIAVIQCLDYSHSLLLLTVCGKGEEQQSKNHSIHNNPANSGSNKGAATVSLQSRGIFVP